MDTHDVSQAPACLETLHKQKRTLENAHHLKGQPPRHGKSRDMLMMEFMLHRMAINNRNPGLSTAIRSSFVPPAYPPCTNGFADLKKTMVNNLVLETHHRGAYLLLRTITPASRMTAVMALVEDEDGSVLLLQLLNQDKDLPADDSLSEGTVLVVKEPYLKIMADGGYGIRVDHLSDIQFMARYHKAVPSSWRYGLTEDKILKMSAQDWKLMGNESFKQRGYRFAIGCYSKALESASTVNEAHTISLNRALCFLKTHCFEASLADIDCYKVDSPSEKAFFRKCQALYQLQRFRECCNVYKVLCKEYPGNAVAKGEFTRAVRRLGEQKHGKYKFKQMQTEAANCRPPHLDYATHIGPVTVKSTSSRGRGLFTTGAVKTGDLLFCEKAFAHAFVDTTNDSQGISLLINSETNVMSMGGQADLVSLIVQKLYKNPSLMPVITDLHHGSYNSVEVQHVDDKPVVDTFLAERIMSLNCFGSPVSSRDSHIRAMSDGKQQGNANEEFDSCGIWALASYINHPCFSNARRSFIGDIMVMRATQDLAPNTEVHFWYKSPFDSEPGTKENDFRHWGFKCSCAICEDLNATKGLVLAKRKRLRGEVLRTFQVSKKLNAAKVWGSISKLEETYPRPASDVPRLSLWDPYLALLGMYVVQKQPNNAIAAALKALESLGYVIDGGSLPRASNSPLDIRKWGIMVDGLVECWMTLSSIYREVAPELEAQAENYARITYKICVGEDETFGETYGRCSGRPDGVIATAR